MAAQGWSFPLQLESGETVNILNDSDGFAILQITDGSGVKEIKVSLYELQVILGVMQSIASAGARLVSAAAQKAAAAAKATP